MSPLDFNAPEYLLLGLAIPWLWWIGRRSLTIMNGRRRLLVTGLRSLVALLLVVCLAEPHWNRIRDRLAVVFLLDSSSSVLPEEREAAMDYINRVVRTQRRGDREDRAGLITFGRDAAFEVPPLDDSWWLTRLAAEHDPRFTNLAAAMKLAAAAFPVDCAKRIVIVSDGNENIDSAKLQAERLWQSGIGIDVVPIRYRRTSDVSVEKIAAPTEVLPSTPFDVRVVLRNAADERSVRGKLRITRETGRTRLLVAEQQLEVPPGKQTYSFRQEMDQAGFVTYEAVFVPEQSGSDSFRANNRSVAYTNIEGEARVLVIENAEQPGRFQGLVELLRRRRFDVTLRDSSVAFSDLADLQQFDSVILADAPRVSGRGNDQIAQFSDDQIRALVQNTSEFGCGLIVLGGPNSYGVGGWSNTRLEEALPVDFEIKNTKILAVGALVLVMDKSGSMSGEKIRWCKAAAAAAADMLSPRDYVGVVTFDSMSHWALPLERNNNPRATKRRIGGIAAGGGTNLRPAMEQALAALARNQASAKHVIVLTDGQTPPGDYTRLTQQMRRRGITVSAVAIGPDADRGLLGDIAIAGGGKFYQVNNPRAIPQIFLRETRRVTKPLIYERPEGFAPRIALRGEILDAIEGPVPPITGYVLTTRKENPLVEVLLQAPDQPPENNTLLAIWQYGSGRSAVLTTDIGDRWAKTWPEWSGYEKLLLQTVRWSLRPNRREAQLRLQADYDAGRLRVTAHAQRGDGAAVRFLNLSGSLIDPDGETRDFGLERTAPGRYVANIPVRQPGNYYLSVGGGRQAAPVRAAVFVPDSAEFRRLESNEALLAELAAGTPEGGEPGSVVGSTQGLRDTEEMLRTDLFRAGLPPARQRHLAWPALLVAAACLFFGDVFARRVRLPTGVVRTLKERYASWRRAADEQQNPLQRLKQRKYEVQQEYHGSGATSSRRFAQDSSADEDVPSSAEAHVMHGQGGSVSERHDPAARRAVTPAEMEEADYTARLLRAKRQAQRDRRSL